MSSIEDSSNLFTNYNFLNIAHEEINKIVDEIEKKFENEIDIDLVEDGLVYFYNNVDKHCVLNINRFKEEIWFSSEISGPSHWKIINGIWKNLRSPEQNLRTVILETISKLAK